MVYLAILIPSHVCELQREVDPSAVGLYLRG